MTSAVALFDSPDVLALVEAAASEPLAAIFVGAGISTEAGLPSWTQLVLRLLQRVAPETESFRAAGSRDADAITQFAERTMSTLGPLAAAAVVKAHLGDEYEVAVAQALLSDVEIETLAPGPTGVAIARLVLASPRPIPVLTTNYDRLLEKAFIAELRHRSRRDMRVAEVLPGEVIPDDCCVVVHLHGLIDETRPAREQVRGRLVLADDEFFAAGEIGEQRRQIAERFLSAGRCLFLGTGLTDPNLLGYLYRAEAKRGTPRPRHATISVRQVPPGQDADAIVFRAIEESGGRRLARAGVEVAFVSTYSDAAQIVRETDLHTRARAKGRLDKYADAPWHCRRRAMRFEQAALRSGLLATRGSENRFLTAQQGRRRILDTAAAALTRGLGEVPAFRAEDEEIALHLWVYSPSTNLLVMAAQSEKLSYNPAIIQSARAVLPTDYLVVDAFCSGTVVEATSPALASARWGSMLAIPLAHSEREPNLDEETQLLSGVIVLASTAQAKQGLSRLRSRPQERAKLLGALTRLGATLIDQAVRSAPPATRGQEPLEVVVPSAARRELATPSKAPPQIGSGTHISGAAPEDDDQLGRWKSLLQAATALNEPPQPPDPSTG
ncbi:MAG: SIR2 family protein [Actinomycetota bacterium]|nr:SIR2 family protein [Actinomycetota bacterium]